VLFIDQERFKGETQRRFRAIMREKGIESRDIKDNLFIRCGTTTRLDLTPSYEAFRRELLEIKPDLVMIDSWASFQSSDENNRQSVQVVLERIKALRTEIGCTVVFIDHENKLAFNDEELPSYTRMVGSIAKPAAAETIFTVRRFDSETVLVHHTKSTLASTVKSFSVKVTDTEFGVKVWSPDRG
jgi:RecA-family ATPase